MNLDLTSATRKVAWERIQTTIEKYYTDTRSLDVTHPLDPKEITDYVGQYDLDDPMEVEKALDHVVCGMTQYAVHTPHPRYFGLFNPRAAFPGVLADSITAAFNPQLAGWGHAPFAVEVEQYLVREMGRKFGYAEQQCDGVFTTGGTEANLTAVLLALTQHVPHFAEQGLVGATQRPRVYASAESHHSVERAVRSVGLGAASLCIVPVDSSFRMVPQRLEAHIEQDRAEGLLPFLIVATGGTTGGGAIDPLPELAELGQRHGLWLHVDAAYGGAVVVEESTCHLLEGIEQADSITFDAHKWLSMPMSTSLLLTRHTTLLDRTFNTTTDYMPKETDGLPVSHPFMRSIQWSRRFSGLKLYTALLMVGWKGFAELVKRQMKLGRTFAALLTDNQWVVKNKSALPIICFTDPVYETDPDFSAFVCDTVLSTHQAWLSTYQLGTIRTLRVCITNYATQEEDLHTLLALLNQARHHYQVSIQQL